MKTVWITKYALTVGIQERAVEKVCSLRMVSLVRQPGEYGIICVHKPYWHETREAAVTHAKKLQEKKLVALQKQLKHVATLTFE